MTFLVRSNPTVHAGAEIRLGRDACPESRLLALRTAIADGRYRIDSQAIAAKMIASAVSHFQPTHNNH